MSHVMSTDGVAFPDINRGALRDIAKMTGQDEDMDVQRALLAIPDKVAIYNDRTIEKELLATELISVNIPDGDVDDDPVGMAAVLVFVVEGRQGIFPLLEFVDYVSFYLHNYTNNFRFVSFLTFFRTCRVQIYDIKRKGTSFRRVILAHWREKTEKSGIGTLLWNTPR